MIKMSIGAQWKSYREVLPEDAGPVQIRETRNAFYAGAMVMLMIARRIGEPDISEEQGVAIFESLHAEMKRFGEAIINKERA